MISEKIAFLHFSCAFLCFLFLNILLALYSSSGIFEFFLCFILHMVYLNSSCALFFIWYIWILLVLYSSSGKFEFFLCFILHLLFYHFSLSFEFFNPSVFFFCVWYFCILLGDVIFDIRTVNEYSSEQRANYLPTVPINSATVVFLAAATQYT